MTPAAWIRQFVMTHPSYRQDSVVSPEIAHDLMMACKEIGEGTRPCPELLGDVVIERYVVVHGHDCFHCSSKSYYERESISCAQITHIYCNLALFYLFYLVRIRKEDAYGTVLAGRLSVQERSALIQRLVGRATKVRSGSFRTTSLSSSPRSSADALAARDI